MQRFIGRIVGTTEPNGYLEEAGMNAVRATQNAELTNHYQLAVEAQQLIWKMELRAYRMALP